MTVSAFSVSDSKDCISRVLIPSHLRNESGGGEMDRKHCEKRKVFSLALKDDMVEQCLRFCGCEFQVWGSKQEKVRKP